MGLIAVRKGERRDTWAAFFTLFTLIAGHSILETARDALFLAKVPASRLPWVFLAVAGLSFLVVKLQAVVARRLTPRRALSMFSVLAAIVTAGFFVLMRTLGESGVYALYIWSGLLTTFVLVHFWALVADLFTITQAKRLYGFIGAGSVLGAIVGSGTASLLATMVHPRSLLLCSVGCFFVAAFVPALFSPTSEVANPEDAPSPDLLDTFRYVVGDRYARRVAGSMFAATVCLTVADYIFKSTVAASVPKRELGAFIGSVNFATNVLSLVAQLVIVNRVLRRFSLGAALAILPALLMLGGLGVVLTGSLAAVISVKSADGALRYTLHRTASELLFLPFTEEARRRVKSFIDVLGQRGGQVLASIVILGFAAIEASPRIIAIALVVLALLWMATAVALRRPYIELYRTRLRSGRLHHVDEFPELDVASLETLISSLESEHDAEVMAALQVLDRENKAHLIPALILYHPSEQVVVRALTILTRAGRKNLVPMIDRVLDHPSPVVRAAVIAARSVLAPDPRKLLMRLSFEESPEVRATIVVNLIASGEFSQGERAERLDSLLKHGTPSTRVALAEAIGRRRATGFDDVLSKLSHAREPEVRRAAIHAIGRFESSDLVDILVMALVDETTRDDAERIFARQGDAAFDKLLAVFDDHGRSAALRWRIPQALIACNAERAAKELLDRLAREPDGSVRYKMIRGLEHVVRRRPELTLDRATLQAAVDETVVRAFRLLDRRLILAQGALRDPSRKTAGHTLLHDLLRDKERNTKERLFRLLGLLYPTDDFAHIFRGLSAGKDFRTTSMELIENILSEPLRTAVMGLCDDGDDQLRLARSGRYHHRLGLDYQGLLDHLLEAESDAVRDVTRYHMGELARAKPAGRAA